jgi:hypothetical protein
MLIHVIFLVAMNEEAQVIDLVLKNESLITCDFGSLFLNQPLLC